MSDPVLGATNCRFCNAPLELTVIDLGKSPLCELPRGRPARDDGGLLSAARPNVLTLLARPAAGLRRACRDLRRVRAYFSAFSDSWVEHALTYVEMISERLTLTSDSLVVELASNDGTCSSTSCPGVFQVLGIDPAANVARAAEERGVETLVDFFGVELAQRLVDEGRTADLVLGNVLAQVPDLNDFVEGFPSCSLRGGHRHIRVPASGSAARRAPVRHDLPRALFVLLSLHHPGGVRRARAHRDDVEELPTHGGSLRVYAAHDNDPREPTDAVGSSSSARSRRACATRCYRQFALREASRSVRCSSC